MSTRAYYQIRLTATTRSARLGEARNLGRLSSPLAHEWPQVKQAPDGTYALLRIHWADDDTGKAEQATYEAKTFVTVIDDAGAVALVGIWTPGA